ncbi:MAG: CoA-transferase [Promethearchaeota archaeon]
MSIEDAIENLVEDGDLIGIGGLSFWRKPMSACRQLIKQNKRDLSICTFVGGIVFYRNGDLWNGS